MHPWSSFRLFTDSTFKFHFGLWSVPADKLLNKMQAFVWIHYSLRPLWTRSLFASACERPKSWTWFRKLNFRLHLTEGKILKVICYISEEIEERLQRPQTWFERVVFFFLVWLPINLSQIIYVSSIHTRKFELTLQARIHARHAHSRANVCRVTG